MAEGCCDGRRGERSRLPGASCLARSPGQRRGGAQTRGFSRRKERDDGIATDRVHGTDRRRPRAALPDLRRELASGCVSHDAGRARLAGESGARPHARLPFGRGPRRDRHGGMGRRHQVPSHALQASARPGRPCGRIPEHVPPPRRERRSPPGKRPRGAGSQRCDRVHRGLRRGPHQAEGPGVAAPASTAAGGIGTAGRGRRP